MIHIKTFDTKAEAVAANDVINRTVVYCQENRQALTGIHKQPVYKLLKIIGGSGSSTDKDLQLTVA